jgi:hypothetical protein
MRNNPKLAGKRAGKARFFGPYSRFAVYPMHTRFEDIAWVVSDAEVADEYNLPKIAIFDTETKAVAYAMQRAAEAEAEEPDDLLD